MTAASNQGTAADRRRGRAIASPRARRAMRERGVDPAAVRGSGPGGRIVEADVLRAAASARHGASTRPHDGAGPQFHLRATADVTSLVLVQRQIAAEVRRLCGTPLRLGDLLLRAAALALADFPEANRVWQGETLVEPKSADVAFEVKTPGARAAPTIRRANGLHLLDLVRRRAELTAAVREGSLPREATPGAAICLCDLTEQPIDEYVAVVRLPHTMALAAGRPAPRPFVLDGRLSVRQTLHLCLSVDPRAVAPETAAGLLGRVVDVVQRPFVLFCERPQP